jgi:translation initiation factor IF-2
VIIHEDKITSLKRFKNDVTEVQTGFECGIGLESFKDFQAHDILEVYQLNEVER